MKMLYAAFVRLPTEKAHGAQIMRTCEAFASQGAQVELCVPGRLTHIEQDAFDYYGVTRAFTLTPLVVRDFIRHGRWGFILSAAFFAWEIVSHVRRGKPDVIYSRDKAVLLPLVLFTRTPLTWEVHGHEPSWAIACLKRFVRVVAISQGIRDDLRARGVRPDRICVAHDGVDLAPFEKPLPMIEARARLGLPQGQKIAMYVGRLDGWKGVETLLESMQFLTEHIQIVIIGGEAKQTERLSTAYPEALFLGYRPYREIADNQAAANVLVLPNTGRDITSRNFTSPLKLFTYMASGKPIVASDLPSLREVVSEKEVFFVEPDDPEALAAGIMHAITAPDAPARALAAREKVSEYTWDKRAERILGFLWPRN